MAQRELEELWELPSRRQESEETKARRAILTPAIKSVVNALGGFEHGVYRLGDECYGCLKDLKRFWRKDDTDDERTVARIFYECRLLVNDLVPIILETAGKGKVDDKCAIACADLITAMTWPVDLASELQELDEQVDSQTDYATLLQAQLSYKAALLQPGVLKALFAIIIPCLAKSRRERKDRDSQIINVLLHLFRNLAFIKDPSVSSNASSSQLEFASLQSKLIVELSEALIFDLLLTLASNAADDTLYNSWNTLLLEIFYLLFRGVEPTSLVQDQAKQTQDNLRGLLDAEMRSRTNDRQATSSRHSRFGTTIAYKTASGSYVSGRPDALAREPGQVVDMTKKRRAVKLKQQNDLGAQISLSVEALVALQTLARTFIESCFGSFLGSILKDIKSERPKVTEKDNLRLLFVTRWFLEFFRSTQARNPSFTFGLVSEVIDRAWVVWMLKRMSGAMDEKPKQWTELHAGVDCVTQLLFLVDSISNGDDLEFREVADTLQHQLYYNGQVLEIAFESIRSYKDQSIAYLDSTIRLSYVLLRMLEKWGSQKGELVVKKRVKKKKKPNAVADMPNEDEDEVEEKEEEPDYQEQALTFEKFQMRFAHEDITRTLLCYLARFREFDSPEKMKCIIGLMHRQAVGAKAEGLFFKVSTLSLFKTILDHEKSLPKDRSSSELIQFIEWMLRRFFKSIEKDPFTMVEAFYPKNRGAWKAFSSWEPEITEKKGKGSRAGAGDDGGSGTAELVIKKGYSWSEQLGIAMGCLIEKGQSSLVDWVKEILGLEAARRQRVVDETDGPAEQNEDEPPIDAQDEDEVLRRVRGASDEAVAKFVQYNIPYVNEEHANAATTNGHLKLLFSLVSCEVEDEGAEELQWFIPQKCLPEELMRSLNVINRFLVVPLDLNGRKATQLVRKKQAKRRSRRSLMSSDEEDDGNEEAKEERQKRRQEKRKKERQTFKSAQLIDDSDGGEDFDEFLKKERALIERAKQAALDGRSVTMKESGTKKRKKNLAKGKAPAAKKRRTSEAVGAVENRPSSPELGDVMSDAEGSDVNEDANPQRTTPATSPDVEMTEAPTKARPKPRRVAKPMATSLSSPATSPAPSSVVQSSPAASSPSHTERLGDESDEDAASIGGKRAPSADSDEGAVISQRVRRKIVDSDEEDD